MAMKVPNMNSLNEATLCDLSIDELESRLLSEDLDVRTELWTGCGCVGDRCPTCHLTCM